MDYRSTNTGQHIGNDIVSNHNSSHGVQLSGGSTGGSVTAVGDDANISLLVSGKGAGAVRLGTTTSFAQFASNGAVGSTAAAAALGNVTNGSSGPTTQAQVGWIRINESSGGACFIPYWK